MENNRDDKAQEIADLEADLTHKVYDTALDNSLWPEMIISVVDHVNRLEALPAEERERQTVDGLTRHFNRAYAISEQIMQLKERELEKSQLLSALACEVTLFDAAEQPFLTTRADYDADLGQPGAGERLIESDAGAPSTEISMPPPQALAERLRRSAETGVSECWVEPGAKSRAYMMIPKPELDRLGFPARARSAMLSLPLDASKAVKNFAATHALTASEQKVIIAMVEAPTLRAAAEAADVTYETARFYLKAIFTKTGASSQAELMKLIFFSPSSFLGQERTSQTDLPPVRRMMRLNDGREMEYFALGPEDGRTVLFIDAMSGSAIDLVGRPERYIAHLEKIGARIITPCRPGTFRSTYKRMNTFCDFAGDVAELCDNLGIERASLLSFSYGSNAALALAHELPDLVERVVMSSVSYRGYDHRDWRQMDLFFQITNVIGRRWPRLLERLLPFLTRSIMQNIHRFAKRSHERAKCDQERFVLSDVDTIERTRAMLVERTAQGMGGVDQEWRLNVLPYDFNIKDIAAPMVLLHGDCDINNPLEGAEALHEDALNSELHILPQRGHHHLFVDWEAVLDAALGEPFALCDWAQLSDQRAIA